MSNVEDLGLDYQIADRMEAEGCDLFSRGEHVRAIDAFSGAAQIFGRLQSRLTNEYLNYRFASAINNTGCAHFELHAVEHAQAAFIQAADLFGQLWTKNSTRSDFGNDFAASLNNLGHLLSFTDKPQTAEKFFIESLRVREEVRSRFPEDTKTLSGLWNTATLLADLYEKLGNNNKAADMRSRAKRLYETRGSWFTGAVQTVNQMRGLSGASGSVGPNDAAEHVLEKLALADYLMTQHLHAEAIETYSELVCVFRSVDTAQTTLMDAKKQLSALLQRLSSAYAAIGDRVRELKYLKELSDCLESAVSLAEGDMKRRLEEHLRRARTELLAKEAKCPRHA